MGPAYEYEYDAFRVETRPARDLVVVAPFGELDLASAPEVQREVGELCGRGFSRIQLDLREVTFIDSSGVRLLLELDRRLNGDGGELTIVDGDRVRRAFDLMGVRAVLRFSDPV